MKSPAGGFPRALRTRRLGLERGPLGAPAAGTQVPATATTAAGRHRPVHGSRRADGRLEAGTVLHGRKAPAIEALADVNVAGVDLARGGMGAPFFGPRAS